MKKVTAHLQPGMVVPEDVIDFSSYISKTVRRNAISTLVEGFYQYGIVGFYGNYYKKFEAKAVFLPSKSGINIARQ